MKNQPCENILEVFRPTVSQTRAHAADHHPARYRKRDIRQDDKRQEGEENAGHNNTRFGKAMIKQQQQQQMVLPLFNHTRRARG